MVSQNALHGAWDKIGLTTVNSGNSIFKCLIFVAQVREHPSLEKGSGEG